MLGGWIGLMSGAFSSVIIDLLIGTFLSFFDFYWIFFCDQSTDVDDIYTDYSSSSLVNKFMRFLFIY